jgi:AcrR family transcriptional regulator
MPAARQRILETASRLFYHDGFHATGIDRIVAESGVTKMTLYRYFPSKQQLVIAVLEGERQSFRERLEGFVRDDSVTLLPSERLLRVFDFLAQWFAGPDFLGCPFIHAASEFTAEEAEAHRIAAAHQTGLCKLLYTLAVEAEIAHPEVIAPQFLLLMQGAIAVAAVMGKPDSVTEAKQVAATLLSAIK